MAKIKNKTSSNSSSNRTSNSNSSQTGTKKGPSITSADSTDLDNRERRDGPGGN